MIKALRIVHRDGNTIAYNGNPELDRALFTLPGEHGPEVVAAVDRIRETAARAGEQRGREKLQAELRRMIGAVGGEDT